MSSLKFQLPILVCLLFYVANANFFHVDVIDELIDRLDIDCVINGNITQPTVHLRQSNLHRYEIEIATGQLEPTLFCNMTSGPRSGRFLLFKFYRDIPRCDIKNKRCTWNLRPDGLFLYFNFIQNLVFNWTMSS